MKKILSVVSVYLIIGIISLIFTSNQIYAADIFREDFTNTINSEWLVEANQGSISFDNGAVVLSSTEHSYPYLSTTISLPNKYYFETRFSFSGLVNYGSGIVLSNKQILNNTTEPLVDNDWIFLVWPLPNGDIDIFSRICPINDQLCPIDSYFKTILNQKIADNMWHKLKIEFQNSRYIVSLDDLVIFESNETTQKINTLWIGNPQLTLDGEKQWKKISIDYIQFAYDQEKPAFVFLPGFGGSLDLAAILSGGSGSNWKIPKFVKTYDPIIESLRNAGLEEGKNLFIFPYDWRKSLEDLASDLNVFLIANNLKNRKINLVGHSMGGLVARTYTQVFGGDEVNKVITVGSPHNGIIDAYGLWEGAKVWDGVWWENALLEVATVLNRKQGETKLQSLRRISPSIKDLMPTESFLKLAGVDLPWLSLKQKNTFLKNLNLTTELSQGKIVVANSNSLQTKSAINVGQRTKEDVSLGLWEDGRPNIKNTFSNSPGDGFVTEKSAKGPFTTPLPLSGGHTEIISKKDNVNLLLTELNLNSTSSSDISANEKRGSFVAVLRSPGTLHVCLGLTCDSDLGVYYQNEKLFILPGYIGQNLKVQISSNGETGDYKLFLGSVNDSGNWKEINGNLKESTQNDVYTVFGATPIVSTNTSTALIQLRILSEKISVTEPSWDGNGLVRELLGRKKGFIEQILTVNRIRGLIVSTLEESARNNRVATFSVAIDFWKSLDLYMSTILPNGHMPGKETYFHFDYRRGRILKLKSPGYYRSAITELIEEIKLDQNTINKKWSIWSFDKEQQIKMLNELVN